LLQNWKNDPLWKLNRSFKFIWKSVIFSPICVLKIECENDNFEMRKKERKTKRKKERKRENKKNWNEAKVTVFFCFCQKPGFQSDEKSHFFGGHIMPIIKYTKL
jgi:hypothetical protein